jgi:hypothetical protein
MSEATLACNDGAERGINYQAWLANRIAIQFMQTGSLNQDLCLEYAKKYGIEAEKTLIRSLKSQSE